MTRLCVICEGQTESEFVNGCLWALKWTPKIGQQFKLAPNREGQKENE